MSPVGTSAYNVVVTGTLPSGAGDAPELVSFSYTFGGINFNATFVFWQPIGKVRFRCAETAGADYDSDWTAAGLSQTSVPVTGLTVGEQYTLYYQIDPIPDYAGWNEGLWRQPSPALVWTQTEKDPPDGGDWIPDS